MMSHEDLAKARAERATKDAEKEAKKVAREAKKAAREAKKVAKASPAAEATIGKKKRGRKRKSATLEADTPEPKAKVVRRSEGQLAEAEQEVGGLEPETAVPDVGEDEVPPEPWRAPVAKMW